MEKEPQKAISVYCKLCSNIINFEAEQVSFVWMLCFLGSDCCRRDSTVRQYVMRWHKPHDNNSVFHLQALDTTLRLVVVDRRVRLTAVNSKPWSVMKKTLSRRPSMVFITQNACTWSWTRLQKWWSNWQSPWMQNLASKTLAMCSWQRIMLIIVYQLREERGYLVRPWKDLASYLLLFQVLNLVSSYMYLNVVVVGPLYSGQIILCPDYYYSVLIIIIVSWLLL